MMKYFIPTAFVFSLLHCPAFAQEQATERIPDTYPITADSKKQAGVPQGSLTPAKIVSQVYDYPTLIRRLANGSRGPNGRPPEIKPIKVFFQDGSNDLNNMFGSWWLANQRMVAALEWANANADQRNLPGPRYQVKYDWGDGGHTSNHGAAILPDVMRWLWAGYEAPPAAGNPGAAQRTSNRG